MIDKTIAILAGGKSSRMNYNNKALLKFRDKTFIENIINSTKDFMEVIIVANNAELYKEFGVRVVKDIYLEQGPLSGIHSALINSKTDKVLCIACDMPLINEDVLTYIGNYDEEYEVLVPKYNDRLQPLCSIYSKVLIDIIEDNLKKNKNKLQDLILNSNYKIIDRLNYRCFREEDFFNVNTPHDLEKIESEFENGKSN
ncbi:molybdenum cofactor guanylyltransferase [Clostridioides difficile]